jgi:hypothetical protein
VFQARDLGDVLALVALDALDDHFAGGALLGLARFGGLGFGGFLLGVFFGALLGVDGQGGEILGERFRRVEGVVEVRVGGREPFLAFFGRAAEFTVLLRREGEVSEWYFGGLCVVWIATKSRTYFWGERADAAVDYRLGRADV